MTQSDAELVNAVLDGKREAFAVLLRRYEPNVRAVCTSVLGDCHAGADASQEAFLKAYQKLGGLRKAEVFGPWLMKIARRCALDAARKAGKEVSLEPAVHAAIGGSNGQLDDDKQELLAAVMRLGASERQVVMLRYFGGHTVKDVAGISGRSVGTVTKQLSRAHKRLRGMLGGR